MPEELRITARADDGEIMAVTHVKHPTYGVQFHPESILTPQGQTMIDNFLQRSLALLKTHSTNWYAGITSPPPPCAT